MRPFISRSHRNIGRRAAQRPDRLRPAGPRFEALEPRCLLSASPGPVADWQLNELSGPTAFDSAGGYNGAYVNSPTLGRTGAEYDTGTSVQFNGTSQDVGIGNPAALNFAGRITISAWIKPMTTSGVQEIIEHGDQSVSNSAYVSLCLAGGSYEIVSSNGGSTYSATSAIPSTDLDTWVHLAGVYNGTTWTLYRDGVQAAQTASPVGAVTVSGNWSIAASGPGASQFFQGEIQDVSIYARALSATEVSELAETDSPALPYASALAASALVQSPMTSGIPGSMILGNGDLNGILWVNNGQLEFQIAKNDVADGVLNTTSDPALPTVNLSTGTWTGNVNYPSMPSWSNYDTPCPVILGQVNISLGGSTLSSTLNVQNATATVTASGGSSLTAMVLQGENVAEFDTSGTVSLAGCSVSYIPSSDTSSGTTNGIQWSTTTIPGNSDVPSMSFALAMATSGTRHVLAVVDSLENANPLAAAEQLAANALATAEAQLQAAQTAAWAHFWAKSGVQLGNTSLQTQWYQNLYYSACASRPGAAPIGLCLGTDDINFSSLWKGIETSDYNFEQAFWGSYDTNHPELSEAYTQYLANYEPVAEWYAQNVFGLSGAAYPHNQWVNESTDPSASTLPRNGLLAYPPYSLGLGLGGWILQNVWDSYLYDPTASYLSTTVYPMMKEAAIFYAGALNACPKDSSGAAIYGPSYVEELGNYGVDDVTSDIGFTQLALQAAIQAAQTLGVDSSLVSGWQQALTLLPAYPTASGTSGTVITDELDGSASVAYNVAVPILPVFPAGVVNWFSSAAQQATFLNTIQTIDWGTANSVVMMAGAYARLAPAMTAYNWIANAFSEYQQANGMLVLNGIQGANFTEGFAVSGVISEMLLQSVGGIVRFFPAMPAGQNASFSDLGAEGGFQVSAAQQNGSVGQISVTASQAAPFEFLSPWQYLSVTINGKAVALTSDGGGVYTIPASAWSASSGTAGMQAVIAQSLPTILAPAADSYVRGGAFANDNYSSDVVLWVKNDPNASVDRQTYLRFNMTGITSPLQSVILTLTPVYLGTDAASMTLGISLLSDASDDWNPSTLTWNNRPQGEGIVETISGAALSVGQPISLDVTSLVEQALNANGLASFQITATSAPDIAGYVEFASTNNSTAAWQPTLAVTTTSGSSGAAAGTTIDGAAVAVVSNQSLGSADDSLTVQNGATVDLGQSSQNVAVVTVANGAISDGTLNATAYDVTAGSIGANLGGTAALVKSGQGTVVLSGANNYSGVTTVLDGTLLIANAAALPDGGSLVIGNAAAFGGLVFDTQQGQAASAAVSSQATAVSPASSQDTSSAATFAAVPDAQVLAWPLSTPLVVPALAGLQSDVRSDQRSAAPQSSRDSSWAGAALVPPYEAAPATPTASDRTWLAAVAQLLPDDQSSTKDKPLKARAVDLLMMTYGFGRE